MKYIAIRVSEFKVCNSKEEALEFTGGIENGYFTYIKPIISKTI